MPLGEVIPSFIGILLGGEVVPSFIGILLGGEVIPPFIGILLEGGVMPPSMGIPGRGDTLPLMGIRGRRISSLFIGMLDLGAMPLLGLLGLVVPLLVGDPLGGVPLSMGIILLLGVWFS